MDKETLELLGYPQILELVQSFAQSDLGRAELQGLRPATKSSRRDGELELLGEYARFRVEEDPITLPAVGLPESLFLNLSVQGTVLSGEDLRELATLAGASADLRLQFGQGDWPRLEALFGRLPDLGNFAREVESAIDPTGEIKDDADPELKKTRRLLFRSKQKAQEHLRKYFSGPTARYLIQEPFVTQRNQRYVIPVRTEHQSALPGVVHGTSSSGATVFVEPLEAVGMNNGCQQLEDRERVLIHRLLTRLTEEARENLEALRQASEGLARADGLEARARFMKQFQCVLPDLSSRDHLRLREARHPLLQSQIGRDRTVPVSVEIGHDKKVLVISGPNAGGKTVALKTAGLLSLMGLAGLPVPAEEACIPCFRQVLADIGDSQSIAENLSTFSAHILRMKVMLDRCERPSLFLLDEVGSGTDPTYGAGLAIAVLEELNQRGAFVIVTTHQQALKQYAASLPSAENASVELDPDTLRPSYHLRPGIAGESSALEMAGQLGLDEALIERARSQLGNAQLQVEAYLKELAKELSALKAAREETEAERETLKQRALHLEAEAKSREQQRTDQAERLMKECAVEFRKNSLRYLKRLEDRFETTRQRRQVAYQEEALKEEFRRRVKTSTRSAPTEQPEPPPCQKGDWVYDSFFKKKGEVLEIDGDTAVLLAGGKRLRSPLARLVRIERRRVVRQAAPRVTLEVVEDTDPELNLVGRTVDEALDLADKFLDRASVSRLREVRLIHGFGTGRLRKALTGFLGSHPQVARFEVDGGVTIVQLKSGD